MKSNNTDLGKCRMIITGVLLLVLCAPLIVYATSFMPFFHSQERGGTAMKSGQEVYLFHSGTDDVRKIVQVGDILTVYRITPTCEVREVGRIKAVVYIGETYLKGKVVEGEIKPDDIGKRGNVSCLVISAGVCKE